jgi:DNA-binding NarL/FixJ family response regulator
VRALRDVAARAAALDCELLAREVRTLAALYRVDVVPAPRPAIAAAGDHDPEQRSADDILEGFGLTARELEVLEGLAAGRTNREIADGLYISVKTASVHVSNILRKMDVPGRQEAGRIAHRLGRGRPSG